MMSQVLIVFKRKSAYFTWVFQATLACIVAIELRNNRTLCDQAQYDIWPSLSFKAFDENKIDLLVTEENE